MSLSGCFRVFFLRCGTKLQKYLALPRPTTQSHTLSLSDRDSESDHSCCKVTTKHLHTAKMPLDQTLNGDVTMKEIGSPAREIGEIVCNCGHSGDLTCMPIGVVAVVEDRH